MDYTPESLPRINLSSVILSSDLGSQHSYVRSQNCHNRFYAERIVLVFILLESQIQLAYNYVSVNCFPGMCTSCFALLSIDSET